MPGPKRHLVIGPAGLQKWADAGDLDNLPEGFRPASAAEVRQVALDEKYSGVGAKVAAFGHGLGSSLTMGGLDVALTEGSGLIGGDAAKARMQASINEMREAAPGAHMLGEVGGLVGGAIGSAGKLAAKGALGKGLALTPGAGVMRGGAALEKALLRGGAGRGTAMAARAGAEGLAFGAGHTLSEASLGNVDLTGETLFASMGESALWGAGTAGALHGTGALLGGAAKRGKDALAKALQRGSKSASRSATEKAFGHGTDALDDLVRGGALADDEVSKLAVEWSPRGKAYRREVLADAVPKRDRMARSIVERGTSVEDDFARFADDFVLEGKHSSFGHLTTQSDDAVAAIANEHRALSIGLDEMATELGDVARYGDEFVKVSAKGVSREGKLLKNLRSLRGGLDEAISSGNVAKMRTQSERIKRYLDANAKSLGRSTSAKTSQFHKAASGRIETTANQWRGFLENEAAWGQAARVQKPMNAALHDNFGFAGKVRQKLQTTSGNHPTRAYLDRTVFDSGKVDTFAKQLVNPAGDTTREALVATMNARAEAAEAVLKHGKPNAKQAEYLTRLRDNAKAVIKDVAETEGSVARIAQLEELARQEAREITLAGEFGGRVMQAMKGAAAAVTGGATSAAAETVGAAAAGGTMGRARKLYALETLADRLRGKMDGSLGKVFGKAAEATRDVPVHGARAVRYFAEEAKQAKRAKTRRDEYEERSRLVRARDEQQASDGAKTAAASVADAAPNTTVAAANTAARAQAYLASALPTDEVPSALMGPRPEASATEVDSWLRKLRAIEDPTSILDDLTDGKLSRDSVEAVKAVYPALYEQMRADVMGRINDMRADGKTLPYRERIDLGTLLDLPTDPMLNPATLAAVQATYAPPEKATATSEQKVPDIAGAFETESEQTEKDS